MLFKNKLKRKDAKTQRCAFSLRLCVFAFYFFCFNGLLGDPWGKDADLAYACKEPEISCCQPPSFSPGVAISTVLIRFHQTCITQIDGPRSHYLPSSSQYTLDAIQKYGFFKGFILGCDRLMRENDEKWIYPTTLDCQGQEIKWDPVR